MSDSTKKLDEAFAQKELEFKQEAEKLLSDLGVYPQDNPDDSASGSSSPAAKSGPQPVSLRKKILVVEDSSEIRAFISEILKSKNLNVIESSNGEDALTKINKNPDIDMVFLELELPKLDGIAFLKLVRKLDVIPYAPVIVTSSNTSPKVIKDLKSLNISGFLVKPLSKDKILNCVEKLSQKKAL